MYSISDWKLFSRSNEISITFFSSSIMNKCYFDMTGQNHFKKLALLKAVRYYGNTDKLAKSIGASRSQVNNWLNRGDKVPYQYAILISTNTGIRLAYLAPYASKANAIITDLLARRKQMSSNFALTD